MKTLEVSEDGGWSAGARTHLTRCPPNPAGRLLTTRHTSTATPVSQTGKLTSDMRVALLIATKKSCSGLCCATNLLICSPAKGRFIVGGPRTERTREKRNSAMADPVHNACADTAPNLSTSKWPPLFMYRAVQHDFFFMICG